MCLVEFCLYKAWVFFHAITSWYEVFFSCSHQIWLILQFWSVVEDCQSLRRRSYRISCHCFGLRFLQMNRCQLEIAGLFWETVGQFCRRRGLSEILWLRRLLFEVFLNNIKNRMLCELILLCDVCTYLSMLGSRCGLDTFQQVWQVWLFNC